jgi:hypothetical protein
MCSHARAGGAGQARAFCGSRPQSRKTRAAFAALGSGAAVGPGSLRLSTPEPQVTRVGAYLPRTLRLSGPEAPRAANTVLQNTVRRQ